MTAVGRAAARQTPPAYLCKLPGGEICVTQEPTHQLLCLTLSGELRNVVDPGGELLKFPTGVACDGTHLFVADGFGDRVHKLKLPGFRPVSTTDADLGLQYPHGVCLHPSPEQSGGTTDWGPAQLLFVADWGNHRIVALDPATLSQVYSFGAKGRHPGELMYPRGVASLPSDRLLLADTDNNRLQIVKASTGAPLTSIGGVEQPYSAIGAPGPGGEGLAFVATMGGRLCIMPLRDESCTSSSSPNTSPTKRNGNTTTTTLPLDRIGLTKEVAMPSGGRILCGLCADERRVLVAGLDEDGQLHLLAARPSANPDGTDGGGYSSGGSRPSSSGSIDEGRRTPLNTTNTLPPPQPPQPAVAATHGREKPEWLRSSGDGGGYPSPSRREGNAEILNLTGAYDLLSLGPGGGGGGGPSKAANTGTATASNSDSSSSDANGESGVRPFSRRAGSARAGRRAANVQPTPVALD